MKVLKKHSLWSVTGLLAFTLLLVFNVEPKDPVVGKALAITVLMAIWWVTEAVPLAVTALLPVILFPILGVMDGKAITTTYFNNIIFLFMGGFIMALAMERWNLHNRIALQIVNWIGVSPGRILMGFMVSTAFLSMWMSNTATTMMMLPIAMSVATKLKDLINSKESVSHYAIGLFLSIAYSSSIGGMATLVGTPTNMVMVKIQDILFAGAPEISFTQWLMFALPLSVTMIGVTWLLIYFIFRPKKRWHELNYDSFDVYFKRMGKMTYEEKWVLSLFGMLVLAWIFRPGIKINDFFLPGWADLFSNKNFISDGTTAILFSVILFLIPSKNKKGKMLMDWKTANKLPWNIVLLFGGGFALAKGFESSGLSVWLGEQMQFGEYFPSALSLLLIIILMSFLTELTSNVASTTILLPVFAGIAISKNIHPYFYMIPLTLAANLAFMLPTATPGNAIVFGTGKISIRQMMKTGILLNMIGVLLVLLISITLLKWVFEISVHELPSWAILK
ncbi:SLC13 family permease [Sunxiuqinia indica]|uniref:SLC13 family permease n=1 Tax=Sunxiuqinia indica TaxID=2692584 RepID=UPI00135C15C6|nr:SLC13 family permease [Sunxiuqinia indica]